MSSWWKVLIGLAVALPLVGFIVGSVVSAADDDPGPRAPIVLSTATADEPGREGRSGRPPDASTETARPSPTSPRGPVGGEGGGDDDRRPIDVVTPRPYDGRDGAAPDRDDGDDDRDDDDDGDDRDDDDDEDDDEADEDDD